MKQTKTAEINPINMAVFRLKVNYTKYKDYHNTRHYGIKDVRNIIIDYNHKLITSCSYLIYFQYGHSLCIYLQRKKQFHFITDLYVGQNSRISSVPTSWNCLASITSFVKHWLYLWIFVVVDILSEYPHLIVNA